MGDTNTRVVPRVRLLEQERNAALAMCDHYSSELDGLRGRLDQIGRYADSVVEQLDVGETEHVRDLVAAIATLAMYEQKETTDA
jgi:hypothetical protein